MHPPSGDLTQRPASLLERVPLGADADAVYEGFVEWAAERGFTLYPAQDEAIIEIVSGSNVILSTPTGTGKSLVAVAAHVACLARGGRTYYTAPIKALVSEKFFALVDIFGAENVGMVTGDSSVNPDAPIVCCTAEILANVALRRGADVAVDQVVMDEFHYYGDPDRGWAWQVPLLLLSRAQFVLMSATLGDVTAIADDLSRRTGRPTARITGVDRPVPLHFSYARTPVHETVEELLRDRSGADLHRALLAGGGDGTRPGAVFDPRSSAASSATRSPRRSAASASPRRSGGCCRATSGPASACTTPACCRGTGGSSRRSPSGACCA